MSENSAAEEKQEPEIIYTRPVPRKRRIFSSLSLSSADIKKDLPLAATKEAESVPNALRPTKNEPVKLSRRLKNFTTSESNLFKISRPKSGKTKERDPKDCDSPRLVQIGEVSFAHKEHVGKDDADQFLVKLLKLREEGYIQIHQQIRSTHNQGYLSVRPPAQMFQQFLEIAPSGTSKVCSSYLS
jgi:hypothetical protein